METTTDIKYIATQLLSALLANPHIYASISDEGVQGQQEQELIGMAIEMAESLVHRMNQRED